MVAAASPGDDGEGGDDAPDGGAGDAIVTRHRGGMSSGGGGEEGGRPAPQRDRTAAHYARMVTAYRDRNRLVRLELESKEKRCAAISEQVGGLEAAVQDLSQQNLRLSRGNADLRREAHSARASVADHELRGTLLHAKVRSLETQVESLERRSGEARALLSEYQRRASDHAQELAAERSRSLCCACMTTRADCAILVCGHCVLCRTCVDRILRLSPSQHRCPVCRAGFGATDTLGLVFS